MQSIKTRHQAFVIFIAGAIILFSAYLFFSEFRGFAKVQSKIRANQFSGLLQKNINSLAQGEIESVVLEIERQLPSYSLEAVYLDVRTRPPGRYLYAPLAEKNQVKPHLLSSCLPILEGSLIEVLLAACVRGVASIYYDSNKTELLASVSWSEEPLREELFNRILLMVGFVTLISLLLLGSWRFLIKKSIIDPISELAGHLGQDRIPFLSNEMDEGATDEIRTLNQAIRSFSTKIQEMERSLAEKQAEAFVGQVAQQVAHDLGSPLSFLKIFAETSQGLGEKEKNQLSSSVRRIENIANDLLQRRRVHYKKAELQPLNVSDLLTEAIREKNFINAQPEKGQVKKPRINGPKGAKSLPMVMGDPVLLIRIFSNVLQNAIDATPIEGTIDAFLEIQGNYLVVKILDTGCGIPKEIRDKIGSQYISHGKEHLKGAGAGLGLYFAKQTLSQWGGDMVVRSEPGKGTEVSLLLPICRMA